MNGFQFTLTISSAAAASACCSPAKSNRAPQRQRSTQCCNRRQHSMSTDIESQTMLHFKEAPQHQHPCVLRRKETPAVLEHCRDGLLYGSGATIGCEICRSKFRVTLLAGSFRGRRTVSDSSLTATASREINSI